MTYESSQCIVMKYHLLFLIVLAFGSNGKIKTLYKSIHTCTHSPLVKTALQLS